MMSKTHIAVGMAAALALAQTGSAESCIAAVIGGSVGGIIADCDITPSRAHRDALVGRLIVVGIALAAAVVDWQTDAGVCEHILANLGFSLVAGVLLFVVLTGVGAHTDHRSFTHSLVAMAAFSFAVFLACAPLLPFFLAGYASHLALDVTNKQGIKLFWPIKAGVSLGLCSAKGVANKATCAVGAIAAIALLALRLWPLVEAALASVR